MRILLYGHYRIVYLVKDGGNIDILGVFHGSLDITRCQLSITRRRPDESSVIPALSSMARRTRHGSPLYFSIFTDTIVTIFATPAGSVATLILSASTRLGLRRAAMKSLVAHLPEGDGMTQSELADMLGITRARLHALKKGRVEQFSLDALVELAIRLGLNVRMSMTRAYERGD